MNNDLNVLLKIVNVSAFVPLCIIIKLIMAMTRPMFLSCAMLM